jgi:hypothetical protein
VDRLQARLPHSLQPGLTVPLSVRTFLATASILNVSPDLALVIADGRSS